MALLTDNVTIVTISKRQPLAYTASVDPNAPVPTPTGAAAGWIELQFGSDGATLWRPVYDAAVFSQLAVGIQSGVSFG